MPRSRSLVCRHSSLQPEQDRRLVREVLVQRSDAHAGLLGHPRGGEALHPFLRQNLSCRFKDDRHEQVGTRLLRLFSRGNSGFPAIVHAAGQCE